MAADTVANLQAGGLARSESKSARKKKAKSEAAAANSSADVSHPTPSAGSEKQDDAESKLNGSGTNEHPYLRELQKNIRNVTKKLNATQKVDSIIAENPGVSLDELVNSRKINTDQKAQALKKPTLQAQLADYEERVSHYKKFAQEHQEKFDAEKEQLLSAHKEELEKVRQTARAEAATQSAKASKTRLLTLSRFLRAAAARRQLEEDDSDVAKAFEGALLLVYGGDINAVHAAEKLIEGASESVPSTDGIVLGVTYADVRQAALDETPVADEEIESEAGPPSYSGDVTNTDPTIANAGLTELSADAQPLNGSAETAATTIPPTGATGDEAANATAEAQWDAKAPGQDAMSASAESFEIVPRNPAETETGAAPMPTTSTQSWADEVPEKPSGGQTPTSASNDGFHEVHHGRGGKNRGGAQGDRGGHRGRGGSRGDGRGRGHFRGDYRGRGRGGNFRGGRGGRDGA